MSCTAYEVLNIAMIGSIRLNWWRWIMIRTKFLEVEYGCTNYQEIDDLINGFIEENPQIEIIDIKYQCTEGDNGFYYISALIIYKESTK